MIKNIAVLRLSALGDCINAYGLVCALSKIQDLNVSFIIDKRFSSLFKDDNDQNIVNLFPVDYKNEKLKAFFNLRKELKGNNVDILLNMQTSIKASICSLFVKAPIKIGYDKDRSREGQRFFVNKVINKAKSPHVLDGYLEFAKSIGYDIKPTWDFKLIDPINKVTSILTTQKNKNSFNVKNYVVIAVGSAKKEKCASPNLYGQFAKQCINDGYDVIFVSGPSGFEKELCKKATLELQDHTFAQHYLNLGGLTTLRQLTYLCSQAKLVLSPDSATLHLANALNTPVIGLFAYHNEQRVGAYNFLDLSVSIYDKLAKEELKLQDNQDIPWRYRIKQQNAMEKITLAMVLEKYELAKKKYLK